MKIRKILREKRGEATVLTVALILGLLLLMCAMAEFFPAGCHCAGSP